MFRKVSIIGTGLLGGSLARELKARAMAKEIVGVCRSAETAEQAIQSGVVDRIENPRDAVKNCDLLVLATPMQAMVPLLHKLQAEISDDTIITDVGSVKTDLYHALKQTVPSLLPQFVLAHPIAGGERSGVAASRLGLFENKHLIITHTEEVAANMVEQIAELWRTVGSIVMQMSLQEHDAIFAKTSHLPHVIAFSLVNFLSEQSDKQRLFDLAAAGFYDFTRIASSDAEMWRDICVTNRAEVLKALDGFAAQIDLIRSRIAGAEQDKILDYFGQAKTARDQGLLNKAESMARNRG